MNTVIIKGLIFIFGTGLISLSAKAQVAAEKTKGTQQKSYSLDSLWGQVKQKSDQLLKSKQELISQEIASDRASRHWFPRGYLGLQSYYTNDPGTILFSKLGERNLTGLDMSTTVMNYPEASRHDRVTLGAEWLIFEGGAKRSVSKAEDILFESKQAALTAAELSEYAKTSGLYGGLIALIRQEEALRPLAELVKSTMDRYHIGQESNPLGHSGLLGLKNLAHRIQGELIMIKAKEEAIYTHVTSMTNLPSGWTPNEKDIPSFFKLIDHKPKTENSFSPSVLAQNKAAQGLSYFADAEAARYLPQVGVFAESNLYNNPEATMSDSYNVGVFVKWNWLDIPSWGAIKQIRSQSYAMNYQAQAAQKNQAAVEKQNNEISKALLEQVKMAEQSLLWLEKQSLIAKKLFSNGLINALQLTEVYARRVDIIDAKYQMEEALIKASVENLNYKNITAP